MALNLRMQNISYCTQLLNNMIFVRSKQIIYDATETKHLISRIFDKIQDLIINNKCIN